MIEFNPEHTAFRLLPPLDHYAWRGLARLGGSRAAPQRCEELREQLHTYLVDRYALPPAAGLEDDEAASLATLWSETSAPWLELSDADIIAQAIRTHSQAILAPNAVMAAALDPLPASERLYPPERRAVTAMDLAMRAVRNLVRISQPQAPEGV